MQSTVTLQTTGLYSSPNQLSVPEGALAVASNVIIKRDNVIEPRRGFQLFGTTFGTTTDRLKQLFEYKTRLLRHWGSTLEFDTGTETNAGQELFEAFTASFIEAQAGLRTKSAEMNGNFYLTSSEGIRKISAFQPSDLGTEFGGLTLAGGINALDVTAVPILQQGNITGFMPQDSTVAYRVLWGFNDLNKNLILGVPSQRAEVYLPLGELIVLDFNNVLQALSNTANQPSPNASIINNTDYVSSLALLLAADADQIQTNLIALSNKLDNNILLANDTGSGVPLTITAISIVNNSTPGTTNNTATITFASGPPDPTNYWVPGSSIYLTGFPYAENGSSNSVGAVGSTGSINGPQTITSVTSTTVTFQTAATGNIQTFSSANVNIHSATPPDTIFITNSGFKNFDAVQFANISSGGALPTGLSPGTTYYLGNVTSTSFQVFTNSSLNTLVTFSAAGSGTNTVTFFMPITSTSINSNDFRAITQPPIPDIPTPDQELVVLQSYLQSIITQLKKEPSTGTPPIISAYSQTHYIQPLDLTTSANVALTITIPTNATVNDFFQIYRSPVLQATGTDVLSELTASDELQQVYEAFPTQAQINAGFINVTDIVPDSFLGADLYTNPSSGVGIANANAIPPFALDINKFKNVMFYANTSTAYIMLLNLLGVTGLITEYMGGTTPELIISDGITTNIYSFVLGVQQTSQIITVADSSNSLNGTYFLINAAQDVRKYYVWYKTSGGTSSDPMVAGATGIEVFIPTNATNTQVADITNDTINAKIPQDFSSTVTGHTILVQTIGEGYTTNSSAGTSGFTVSTPIPGVGQKIARITGNFTTVADVAGNLAGTYFTITSAFNKTEYYIWYKVSGSGVDPLVTNATGIQINITTGDSATTVATKTAAQLNLLSTEFVASSSGTTLIVSPFGPGSANNPTVGTSGFTLNSISPGFLQVLLSNNTSPSQATNETAESLVQVINQNPAEIIYAYYLSQSSTVPGEITLESRSVSGNKFYVVANNSTTGAAFNPNLSPTITISSITAGAPGVNVVTTTTPYNVQTGQQVFITSTNSTPIVDGLWTITELTPTTFTLPTTVISPSSTGFLVPAASANAGDNNALINNVSYSNILEPESVPLGNTLAIGDADKPILRIVPLRDSLFVFKADGLFRISGETAPWTVQLFDTSCVLIAPDSIGVTKNVIYAWTTQGVLTVTEAGVSNPPISRPIDTSLLPLTSNNYPNFTTATWGVGYDSDNSYIVFTVQQTTDTEATIAYRYSTLTSSWTTWDKTDTCGIVDILDDRLYLGAGDTNSIEQERKTFSRYDYADREFIDQLNTGGYLGNRLILSNVSNYKPGDVLVQTQDVTIYEFNALLQKLNLDTGLQSNSISTITTGSTPTIITVGNHFLSTGDFVDISGTLTTPIIDGIYEVTVTGATTFTINVTSPVLTGGTTGLVKYDYFESLMITGGVNLQNALVSLATRLNIEPNLIYKFDSVSITSNSVANPTVLTLSSPHTLGPTGTKRIVRISGVSGSTPSINNDYQCTVIDSTHISIPVNVTISGTGGTLQTLDDYLTGISQTSGTITNIEVNEPSVVTSVNHGLVSNRYINITGSDSNPVIDGNYTATVIDRNTFSVPVDVLVAGTTGSWITNANSFQDDLVNYNFIIQDLNNEVNTSIKNYMPITNTTSQETIILAVDYKSNTLTTDLSLDLVIGPISIFQAIDSTFTYSPVTFKDALNLKQVSEATLMFENKAFSSATLSFASDLVPQFFDVPFEGTGNGSFGLGSGVFGQNYFGGGSNAAPFRTYIPRNIQRCRYIVPQFTHRVARELYSINGLTLTGNIGQSSRAYR